MSFLDISNVTKAYGKVEKPGYKFISHSNISTGLIADVYIISLIMQALKGAAHTDNIIIRMRGEDDNFFWIGR